MNYFLFSLFNLTTLDLPPLLGCGVLLDGEYCVGQPRFE